ncbi:MAG: hypothetical protein RID09_12370 [Coleofasciculus sp. G1-WW12-02]|uniref:hypothetical protein n=1 Tax=unclassified Coleofasciculus TaxID=2692782 RepID=UPI0032F65AED
MAILIQFKNLLQTRSQLGRLGVWQADQNVRATDYRMKIVWTDCGKRAGLISQSREIIKIDP